MYCRTGLEKSETPDCAVGEIGLIESVITLPTL